MPKFCANLKWLFTELPFLDRFDAAAKAGFTAVEYASPYEFAVSEIQTRLAANGLTQVLINTPAGDPGHGGGSGLACVPGQAEAFRASVRLALDYASALDCRLVHLMAGIKPADVARDVASAVYTSNLDWAADVAQSFGIRLVLEAVNQRDVPGFFLETQEHAAAFVEAIGSDKLGLQFDIYHAQVAGGDVTRRMQHLFPIIAHMQLADVPGRNEPGTGELHWDYIFKRIDELGYQGFVGCEYRPVADTLSGLGWRKKYAM